jgi:hypothetical protein
VPIETAIKGGVEGARAAQVVVSVEDVVELIRVFPVYAVEGQLREVASLLVRDRHRISLTGY